jgi:two-component system OmpR family sensor kinase
MVAVVALVCLILSVTTELALRPFLVAQLDRQLDEASRRAQDFSHRGPPGPGPLPELPRQPPINAPGQGAGTVNARIVGGAVTDAQWLNTSGTPQALPPRPHHPGPQ